MYELAALRYLTLKNCKLDHDFYTSQTTLNCEIDVSHRIVYSMCSFGNNNSVLEKYSNEHTFIRVKYYTNIVTNLY